jgi:ribosomal protein L34E
MYDETMPERCRRRAPVGKVRTILVKKAPMCIHEREEMDKILNSVNTTRPRVNMVRIDSLSIS